MLDRIAVISDVHGNVTALRAVLADIEARGITRVVNLGDVIGKGPRGSEAVRLSREACEVTVRGNWDSFVARTAVHESRAAQWTRDELSDADLAWLAALPGTCEFLISGRRVRLFHASQASEFVRVRVRHSAEEFRAMFTNTEFTGAFRAGHATGAAAVPDVVGYGDIHSAYLKTREGLTLFNVGGTGKPPGRAIRPIRHPGGHRWLTRASAVLGELCPRGLRHRGGDLRGPRTWHARGRRLRS